MNRKENCKSSFISLEEIDSTINNYIHTILVEYTTRLMNKLLRDLDANTFCVDGLCYYTRCENDIYICNKTHCKFNIFTNEEKCKEVLSHKNKNLNDNEISPFSREHRRQQDIAILRKILKLK